MASWMIHLRIAQAMLDRGGDLLPIPFIMGNLAPDSGVPADDGYSFIPDKHISHFSYTDERGKMHIHPEKFAEQYLAAPCHDREAHSFYLGYYAHLVTDRQWIEEIYALGIAAFPELHCGDKRVFAARIKADWYDMDYAFLKEHSQFPAWVAYQKAPFFPNRYLDFFSEAAFEGRKAFILDFYRRGVAEYTERKNHLSRRDLEVFVTETADRVLEAADRFSCFCFSV